jgi:hypothetical protein
MGLRARCSTIVVPSAAAALVALAQPDASFASEHVCSAGIPEGSLPPIPDKAAAGRDLDPALGFLQRTTGPLAAGAGALAGKAVYVSAGHGIYWTGSGWNTQRDNQNGIIEDMVAAEAVNQYLIPYLHAMGAFVVAIRDPGMNPHRVIVDDADAMIEGAPREMPTGVAGWGEVALPIASDDVRPFAAGGARALLAQADPGGGLVYAPEIPEAGHYAVLVSFVAGDDRVSDAHYVVRHSGGETHFRIDQAHHGSTWVLLGEFHFEAGLDLESAAVVVLDDSQDVGGIVSADAVRFGGGIGVHDRGGGPADRPMYEYGARYSTQWAGAPYEVFGANDTENNDNYSARQLFAAWEHPQGEDAVYVAWHTNGLGVPHTLEGTSSYTYSSFHDAGEANSTANFNGVAGSRELQQAVHAQIVGDLRAAWDPDWVDEGQYSANLSEVNPNLNGEFPAALFEVSYHDNPSQAAQLRNPRFRQLAARAMAQGIAEYFAAADGVPLVLPPEPPSAVWVRNDGAGGLEVGWQPPEPAPGDGDPPDGYVVQVSRNGYGFDDGTVVAGTTHTLAGLEPGDVRHVRVLGINGGGHSLPSPTVSAGVAASGAASVLVVAGFDRIDGALLVPEDASSLGQGTVDRMFLHRINDGTYSVRHAGAIAAAGYSFDGATDDAIELGDVDLEGYQAIDWFAGEDSVNDDRVSAVTRAALTSYLDGGGRLLLSGSELAWALDLHGDSEEQAFCHERVHARYAIDDAETYDVVSAAGPLAGVSPLSFADPTAYDPRFPDVLEPETGGVVALTYTGGVGTGAAIAWGEGSDADRGVLLGFPFETVATEAARNDLMAHVLAFFEVHEVPGDDDDGGGTNDGDAGGDDTTMSGDDADTVTSGSATEGGDGDHGSTGDSAGMDGGDGGDGGCGCAQGRRTSQGPWLLLLLLGPMFVARRGRRTAISVPREPRRRRSSARAMARRGRVRAGRHSCAGR